MTISNEDLNKGLNALDNYARTTLFPNREAVAALRKALIGLAVSGENAEIMAAMDQVEALYMEAYGSAQRHHLSEVRNAILSARPVERAFYAYDMSSAFRTAERNRSTRREGDAAAAGLFVGSILVLGVFTLLDAILTKKKAA